MASTVYTSLRYTVVLIRNGSWRNGQSLSLLSFGPIFEFKLPIDISFARAILPQWHSVHSDDDDVSVCHCVISFYKNGAEGHNIIQWRDVNGINDFCIFNFCQRQRWHMLDSFEMEGNHENLCRPRHVQIFCAWIACHSMQLYLFSFVFAVHAMNTSECVCQCYMMQSANGWELSAASEMLTVLSDEYTPFLSIPFSKCLWHSPPVSHHSKFITTNYVECGVIPATTPITFLCSFFFISQTLNVKKIDKMKLYLSLSQFYDRSPKGRVHRRIV